MPNRLAKESSPYLLQHAENPVDWYPWGTEALDLAREKDRPIFLSIGYSACHWCHVMEHESFENDAIAQVLNDNFVSIKVDREERPDLDHIYMNAVMALQQGQGGWPLSVFLTPQQDVFFGGTYWPPTSRVGMPGFDHVLHSVLDAYANRRDQINSQSQQITQWLNRQEENESNFEINEALLVRSAEVLRNNFDATHGGFGSAPKFPHCMDLALLVRMAGKSTTDASVNQADRDQYLEMVRVSLKKMAYGGIFDHLGGGFARYSVDERWLVPHFEKMLYDNSLLTGVYLDTFAETNDRFYAMIAEKTLNYLLNYLRDESGGFHSTEDADSEGVEGKFYVWSKSEIQGALGDEIGERFCELYNVTEQGNFEGQNILNMTKSYQEFADAQSIDKEQLRDQMRSARAKLLQIRDQRIRPGKDDKVLASWNGLAISAFAKAAKLLDSQEYADAAIKSAEFIWSEMRDNNGMLLHTWRQGIAKIPAFLDDYASLLVGYLDLYNVALDVVWLERARELAEKMVENFADDSGGFFFTSNEQEELIARPKFFQDSSVPSGNAMAALGLIRLGRIFANPDWIELGRQTILAGGSLIQRSPLASGQLLIAVDELHSKTIELVAIVNNAEEKSELFAAFRSQAAGNSKTQSNATLVVQAGSTAPSTALSGIFEGKSAVDGQPTLYLCSEFSCQPPIVGMQSILNAIGQLGNSQTETAV